MENDIQGIKTIQVHARTRYPIVSAYEFEFLKSESELQALVKPSTIYFILQRPLVYINKLTLVDGEIKFEITDGSSATPLRCVFDPRENGFGHAGEEFDIEIQFYKRIRDEIPPFCDVAGVKLFDSKRKFLAWIGAQKFIYQYLCGELKAEVEGDISAYINYKVHYIGQSFSQKIWNRLTGHEKMQSILTREDSLNSSALKSSFEISLLLLEIDGFDEANTYPFFDHLLTPGTVPIPFDFSFEDEDTRYEAYLSPKLSPTAHELTNEVEALLISLFKPRYNEIKFENYPNIKSGTRSAGYSESTLIIERIPAILFTDHHTQGVVLPGC